MSGFRIIKVGKKTPDLHEKIRVAVGNLVVHLKNIEDSLYGNPNATRTRKKALSQLLNDVVKFGARNPEEKIDLLILPEVSVPHQWNHFITRWAKDHQVGVICGLEHRIEQRTKGKDRAWNELLAVLPFKDSNGINDCAPTPRLKRHYSPEETFQIENNGLEVPKLVSRSRYHLFQWRGASFAVYNCYELASLEDRGIFKSKVDFLICSEFNRDTGYFSSIVESAARDLHCYVIQVNCAQYGDSRIVSPSKTEKMNPLRIKGGDNQTFLTMELPLRELRTHQRKLYGLQKESGDFKPTPPDFDIKEVKKRIQLGNKQKK